MKNPAKFAPSQVNSGAKVSDLTKLTGTPSIQSGSKMDVGGVNQSAAPFKGDGLAAGPVGAAARKDQFGPA